MGKILIYIFLLLGLWSCREENQKPVIHEKYTGPLLEIDSVNTLYSDSAKMKMRIIAAKQLEYNTGNREFPNGIKLVFYKHDGTEDAVLIANSGKYDKQKELYTAIGNVLVENHTDKKRLTTEELNWNPKTKKVYTDKFVVIKTADQIIKGHGLTAPQDFSTYEIKDVTGIVSVND